MKSVRIATLTRILGKAERAPLTVMQRRLLRKPNKQRLKMTHYTNQLEISIRAQMAASNIGDKKEEAMQKGNCENYETLIAMDMPKVWESNTVN